MGHLFILPKKDFNMTNGDFPSNFISNESQLSCYASNRSAFWFNVVLYIFPFSESYISRIIWLQSLVSPVVKFKIFFWKYSRVDVSKDLHWNTELQYWTIFQKSIFLSPIDNFQHLYKNHIYIFFFNYTTGDSKLWSRIIR